ncbi:MBL fold metallo-hydrolase [Erythrobacter crassostreae]|uniref:MBL fold metallo-hydrolase n=1 Tax=Erythrobacter crassostreae TaxID=2828328 RepID=A0A9X1F732_9SPHN|nr:MBL fold metallo-hydrolase [Erythrobacter crassostrea]MBV7260000.1 MBL fold metallo-hydrolase [Erythrobacter crassostrea]
MNRLAKLTFTAAAALALTSPTIAQRNFDDVEIKTEEIAPGVAVLFGAGGNIGLSYGEDATVLIDDQFAPLSGKIEAAVEALGAQPVKYVVNTHWHGDHTGGNEHFGKTGATIFAHDNVRVRMSTDQQRGTRVTPASPKEALPVVTYGQGMRFHLNGDTINLMFLGGGHTDGDSVVIWEEKNVVHMGDLYFKIPGYPFIDVDSGGDVYAAMQSLDLVIAMIDDETKVIPGHGPMSTKSELVAYRAMIVEAVTRVEALNSEAKSLEEAIAANPLADFDRGEGFISEDAFVTAIWRSIEG